MLPDVRAAIATEIGGPIVVEQVALRGPGPGEVLVQNKAAGLCHSDLNVLDGKSGRAFPIILGHESAGIVLECGPGVTRLLPGDHVAGGPLGECGQCENCRSRRTNQCARSDPMRANEVTPFLREGLPLPVLRPVASFATHSVAPEYYYSPIDRKIPFDVACLFGCAVMTGLGAALIKADIREGDTVAVFGLGGVGLNVIDGARLRGVRTIIGVDLSAEKAALARQFGLTHFIDGGVVDDVVGAIRDLSDGGVDHSFECAGNARLAVDAMLCTRPEWGVSIVVGASRDEVPMQPIELMRGRSWKGAFMGGARALTDTREFLELFQDGKLNTEKLISSRINLEDINVGYEMMRKHVGTRSVVMM